MDDYMGQPDGSTEDLENFLDLGYDSRVDFAALGPRVIVGRKGSGKSLGIRKFFQGSQRDPKRFALEVERRAPNLDGIVTFSTTMPHRVRTNSWQSIWDYAILICAITNIIYNDEYRASSITTTRKKEFRDEVEFEFANCLLGLRTRSSVYDVVNIIVRYFDSYDDFAKFLYSPITTNFKSKCAALLKQSPTICIYLDSLDDEMRRAPSILTDVTRALFYSVVKDARDGGLIPNVHIMITMRDVVFSTIMSSDHSDRFLDTNYVLFLFWPPRTSRRFLDRKISQTQKNLSESDDQNWDRRISDLPNLLGFSQVANEMKDTKEHVTSYFLRHTNFVPRNTVRFGNRVYKQLANSGSISEKQFKKIVSDIAKEIANTLLTASSAYLVAASYDDDISYLVQLDEDLRAYLRKGPFSERTVGDVVSAMEANLTDGFKEPIFNFMKHIGKDVFSREQLQDALSEFTRDNSDYNSMVQNFGLNKLENVLWIQGLIGIRQANGLGDRFYYFSDTHEQTSLPIEAESFVFFPGLNEVCSLEITQSAPVGPTLGSN